MIYFDNNSTTRVFESTVEAMLPYLTQQFANPASALAHMNGITRRLQIEKNRLARALGADSGDQLIITSGATESNNLALRGAARANRARQHIVVSAIEHPSILETCENLGEDGFRITHVPVDRQGVVDADALVNALSPETLLVSVMLANNETGVIQPVGNIADTVKKHDPLILVHTDATQAVGKIAVDLSGALAEVDLLSLSAHKFHGPKGTGALFVRDSDLLAPLLYGGRQQHGLRAGTENTAAVVGMVAALTGLLDKSRCFAEVAQLRTDLESRITGLHAGAFVLGAGTERLPNTINICLPGMDAEDLVDRMASADIAISAGSACSYGARKPSYVALAHGLSYEQSKSCVRVSLSVESRAEEVDRFLQALNELVTASVAHSTQKLGSA
ncbi:MAG: cysteine desulfurase [Bryobacteraceae bacterium]|nr:cysteine desulfurase [Bryobacteraceae bacterium]